MKSDLKDNKTHAFAPLEGGTVVDHVLNQIRNAISVGKFKSGDRLPSEFELMDELNVSRNSLREAMKILSALGIVEIRRGDGTYICDKVRPSVVDSVAYSVMLESSNSEELVEFRSVLEMDVLRLAIQKATPEDIKNIQAINRQMCAFIDDGDIEQAGKCDYKFHQYLVKCSHNRFLERMFLGVYTIFEKSIANNLKLFSQLADVGSHHQGMIDCIINKDINHVGEVVETSLSGWRHDAKKKVTTDYP